MKNLKDLDLLTIIINIFWLAIQKLWETTNSGSYSPRGLNIKKAKQSFFRKAKLNIITGLNEYQTWLPNMVITKNYSMNVEILQL